MTNDEKNKNEENQEKKDTSENIIEFANYIFEQVKLQQETRNVWFGHFLAMVGGVVSFATFTLAFFDDVVTMKRLEQILGIIFAITGVIGIVFFLLFLNQRVNYKLHYKVLNEIQKVVIEKYLSNNYEYYYPSKRSPFRKFKKGADYWAMLIQNIVIVICVFVSCLFLCIGNGVSVSKTIALCCFFSLIMEGILQLLYYLYEKII